MKGISALKLLGDILFGKIFRETSASLLERFGTDSRGLNKALDDYLKSIFDRRNCWASRSIDLIVVKEDNKDQSPFTWERVKKGDEFKEVYIELVEYTLKLREYPDPPFRGVFNDFNFCFRDGYVICRIGIPIKGDVKRLFQVNNGFKLMDYTDENEPPLLFPCDLTRYLYCFEQVGRM